MRMNLKISPKKIYQKEKRYKYILGETWLKVGLKNILIWIAIEQEMGIFFYYLYPKKGTS